MDVNNYFIIAHTQTFTLVSLCIAQLQSQPALSPGPFPAFQRKAFHTEAIQQATTENGPGDNANTQHHNTVLATMDIIMVT